MRRLITLDANAILSGFIGYRRTESKPGEVLRRARSGDFDVVVSDYILAETERVLRRPWFARHESSRDAWALLAALREDGIIVTLPADIPRICRDPKDDAVIATAVAGNADALVTGDDDLLALGEVAGVRILDPAAFVALLDAAGSGNPSPAG